MAPGTAPDRPRAAATKPSALNQLVALRAQVGAREQRPRRGIEREQPPVEQRRGLGANWPDQRLAVLHAPDLVGGHDGTPSRREAHGAPRPAVPRGRAGGCAARRHGTSPAEAAASGAGRCSAAARSLAAMRR